MKNISVKIILLIVLISVLFASVIFFYDNIGVSPSKIESDIRSSQCIKNDWIVDGNVGDEVAAFISYPDNKDDSTFSVYVKHSGLSYGYFFRAGGSVAEIDDGIACFSISECNERAFISMNGQKVVKAALATEEIDIESERPFAIVVPVNAGNVIFYDADGNIVEYYEHSM